MDRQPIIHSMTRRSNVHDYSRPGFYHITMHVAEGLGRPLGTVVGSDADTAAVALTATGTAVERELLTSITAHYRMIAVDTYVIMPEHLHFILKVSAPIVSTNGRSTHLGQVMAGFKQGCNQAYWAATGQDGTVRAAEPHGTVAATGQDGTVRAEEPHGTVGGTVAAATVNGGFAAKKERYDTGRPPLFAPGYCDVMPIDEAQLSTQRAYIAGNPRSRWLRMHDCNRLQPQRDGIDTALTPAALRGYLQRECPQYQANAEALAQVERRLMIAGDKIACHSYGDRALLKRRLLPVVCHRKDRPLFEKQKQRCLEEAERGAVLVSPRIHKGEQLIMDEAVQRGFPVVLIADNGFPEVYHPSTERIERCAAGRLLIVTPWKYQYRHRDEGIIVMECKTMNCVAQAICRTRDDWWKNNEH